MSHSIYVLGYKATCEYSAPEVTGRRNLLPLITIIFHSTSYTFCTLHITIVCIKLCTGGWDKCINVYNVEDVQHMFQLEGAHTMPITCVQWLDRHLLSTSADKTAVLWDSTTGLRKQTFEGKG